MKIDLTDTTASNINKALVRGRRAIGTPNQTGGRHPTQRHFLTLIRGILKDAAMNSKFAAGALTALIYFQALLGFAGVATVLLKERTVTDTAYHDAPPRIEVAAL